MPTAALAPLSSRQKQVLGFLARMAFAADAECGGAVGQDISFDDWRHEQVRRTVQRARLRDCLNEDYLPLSAHFHQLIGNMDAAFKASFKSIGEPREWALFSLYKEATAAKDVMPHALDYARGFLKNKRHVALEDADDKAIWHAIFTVRRKAQSLRKKQRGGESAGDVLSKLLGPRRKPESEGNPF